MLDEGNQPSQMPVTFSFLSVDRPLTPLNHSVLASSSEECLISVNKPFECGLAYICDSLISGGEENKTGFLF